MVEIVNAIKPNSMCIDFLIKGEHNKIKKDKLDQKKGLNVNPKTGEIDLKDLDLPMSKDVWLGTYSDEQKELIQLNWDYNGWRKYFKSSNLYIQHDWNQTLITRINQIAATIRKQEITGKGAKDIRINPMLLPLLQELEYFTESDDVYTLSGRYLIILDNKIPENEIIVLSEASKGKINVKNYNKKTWIEKLKKFFSFNTK